MPKIELSACLVSSMALSGFLNNKQDIQYYETHDAEPDYDLVEVEADVAPKSGDVSSDGSDSEDEDGDGEGG
ncbi:hypothetical protein J7337_007916 [Fusarium musae]|uniref:Uncharacterized protein n=1 Tax=Fusarium musae TaxID=1042133 RepID=A0A9P8IN39_9HYPO|nr:hypothetical protein J7337_007916 [Fusarium musae]KAG9499460.1 hypothetical protein J7337_007916 [Fusarium musae]